MAVSCGRCCVDMTSKVRYLDQVVKLVSYKGHEGMSKLVCCPKLSTTHSEAPVVARAQKEEEESPRPGGSRRSRLA